MRTGISHQLNWIIRECYEPLTRYENCGLLIRRECRERFPRHRLQRKPLVNDPGMHHGTCVTHVPWCMSGSLVRGGGENVPGIPGACATCNFTYLARGPFHRICDKQHHRMWCITTIYNRAVSIADHIKHHVYVFLSHFIPHPRFIICVDNYYYHTFND